MRLLSLYTLLLVLSSLPIKLYAEYSDYRNQKVDSLEQVIKIQRLKPDELSGVYRSLISGYQQTNREKSIYYAKLEIELSEKHHFYNGLYDAWMMIGLHAYGQCDYDSAQLCFDRALRATELMVGDKRYNQDELDNNFSRLYGTLGNLYNIQGKLHLALDYYQKALPIFKRNGWKESESILYYNVGELYLELGNNEAAEGNYQDALDVALDTGDSLMISGPYAGLAMTALNTGKYEIALDYAQRSIEYYKDHKEDELNSLLDGYVLFSRIYQLGFQDLATAQQYLSEGLKLAEDKANPTNLSDAYAQQATLCLERTEWAKAIEWAKLALEANDQDPQHNVGVFKTLAEAYGQIGNAAEARIYIKGSSIN